MGFGLLFTGYFIANLMSINLVGPVFRILGFGLVLWAILKLRNYHRAFDLSIITTSLMLLVSSAYLAVDIWIFIVEAKLLPISSALSTAQLVIGYCYEASSFLFLSVLFYGILKISKETEVKKISVSTIRNFIFVCVYYAVCLVALLPFSVIRACAGEFKIISLFLNIAVVFLNLILFAQCYANICDESDVEMKQKPSRFAFVNRFREEFERRAEKARIENEEYQKEKLEKRKNKRKKR